MKQLDSFKNSSTPQRSFFLPVLLVTLLLHGAFLMLPTGANTKKNESSEDKSKTQVQPTEPSSLQPTPQLLENQTDSESELPTLVQRQPIPQRSQTETETESDAKPVSKPANATTKQSRNRPSSQTNQQTRSQGKSTRPPQKPVVSAVSQWKKASSAQSSSNSSREQQEPVSSNSSQTQNTSTPSDSSDEQRTSATTDSPQVEKPATANSLPEPQQPDTQPDTAIQQTLTSTHPEPFSTDSQGQQAQSVMQEKNCCSPASPLHHSSAGFLKEFPYYFGSWLTSGGLLKPELNNLNYIYYTGDDLQNVAANFEKQLKDKGFTVKEEIKQDTFLVYQVSKDNTIQYLHLIFKNGKTAILLDSKANSLDELENKSQDDTRQASAT